MSPRIWAKLSIYVYSVKKGCMQEGPRIEKCPIAIKFLSTYVIVMGVSNHSGSIKMETSVLMAMKLASGPVHHGYIKITSKGMGVQILVKITDRSF